ncbi:MAG: hypothetical protein ACREBZ_01710 [Thermoplasmata archaeon]
MAESIALSMPAPDRSPVPEILSTVWDRRPALLDTVRGRWRWRESAERISEVRELLLWKLVPGSISIDLTNFAALSLEANRPGDHPSEVILYPARTEVAGTEGRIAVGLLLFYALPSSRMDGAAPERARAYYRVIETLDHWADALAQLHPDREVRAIDLPMPGWMQQLARPTTANACQLLS